MSWKCTSCSDVTKGVSKYMLFIIVVYTGCNWKVWTKFWAQVLRTKTRKNVHIHMCPATFSLWVMAARIQCRHQQHFSINVWTGIVGECLVGPHDLSHQLTGNNYWDFLLYDLPKLLKNVLLAVRAPMWYMHDCAPAHLTCALQDVNNSYNDKHIGRGLHIFTCGDP
jgi:hypothetical protein